MGYINDSNDGLFFMPYDHLFKHFDAIEICFYNDDY